MPIPKIPGGHHPAPIVGKAFMIVSETESLGLSINSFDLASDPPPLAAQIISRSAPEQNSK